MIKDLLPIGSVVLLNGGSKRLMIFGIKQLNQGEKVQEFDYVAVPYPEGNIGTDAQYLFNHTDIQAIFHRGYEDEERADFINTLDQLYENGKV